MTFILEEADLTYTNDGKKTTLLCSHDDILMESPYGILVDFADNRSNRELRETPRSRRREADTGGLMTHILLCPTSGFLESARKLSHLSSSLKSEGIPAVPYGIVLCC